jgi:AraC-like DNA-binding protein
MDASTTRIVPIPDRPLSVWLRLAHILGTTGVQNPGRTPIRSPYDFELFLQLDGVTGLWSGADQGIIDVPAGSIAFLPPGFANAWVGGSGRHLAVHFDLHAQPDIEAMKNWRVLRGNIEHRPVESPIPPFALHWHEGEDPLIIPLVTALPNPAWFGEQLGILVEIWNRRAVGSLDATLEAGRVIGAVLRALALPMRGGRDRRIIDFVGQLDDVLGTRMTVADMAARAGMPETTFREAFTREMGTSPRRYVEERRIERAAHALVSTDGKVNEIARTVGYEDPYHFSRAFKRIMGTSPRAFRRLAFAGELMARKTART